MAARKTGQRYFVAEQTTREDGKVVLTLLEEGKDSNACVSTIRSEEFVKKYAGERAFRVAIIRSEPAIKLVRRPNDLAAEIAASPGASPNQILAILAKHGIAVSDGVEAQEAGDVPGGPVEGTEEPEEASAPPAPAAPAPPASSGPDYKSMSSEQLIAIVKQINPNACERLSKIALLMTISRHQAGLGVFIPGPDMVTPGEGEWSSITCPHCSARTWMDVRTSRRVDQTDGYPEHGCPGYLQQRQMAEQPPVPPPAPMPEPVALPNAGPPVLTPPGAVVPPQAPPPTATMPVAPTAPPPAAVPAQDGQMPPPGLVQPPAKSGQAGTKTPRPPLPPGFGTGFGPPPPPAK